MLTPTRVMAFGAGLALVFGTAFGIGKAIGPLDTDPPPGHTGHGDSAASERHAEDTMEHDAPPDISPAPGGLQVSERGYTLRPLTGTLPAGVETDFRFRVIGPGGEPLTAYQTTHEKDLHLIVVRRDLTGYQHAHPTLAADGTWSVPLTLGEAGTYRVFADFDPAGDPDGPLTLGADIAVGGEYTPTPPPEPARTATVDGYTVTLEGQLTAGGDSALTLSVSRDGKPVTDLQPYLGAYGHLVALRAGDLAYLHVHPDGTPGDGVTPAGPGITFHTSAPSTGGYRLFLDFRHGGSVHTAAFTLDATAAKERPDSGHETHTH